MLKSDQIIIFFVNYIFFVKVPYAYYKNNLVCSEQFCCDFWPLIVGLRCEAISCVLTKYSKNMNPLDFCENILNQLPIGWTWREWLKIIIPNYNMLIYLKEEYYNLFDTKWAW